MREGILGPPLEFVNADLHERAHLQHITSGEERSRAARTWADGRRATLLATRTPFATETVFSHPSKLDLIANAQRQGFTVALYVVGPAKFTATSNPAIHSGFCAPAWP